MIQEDSSLDGESRPENLQQRLAIVEQLTSCRDTLKRFDNPDFSDALTAIEAVLALLGQH